LKFIRLIIIILITVFFLFGIWTISNINSSSKYSIGQKIDSLNGVYVYYNGNISNVSARNTTSDGYNIGLEYQCVEFVKRYYYQHLKHKMPDSYGHAKDYFDRSLNDGQINEKRNLTQFSNPSEFKPKVDDLIIFDGTRFNKFGHVAIISSVTESEIEIIQQNAGQSREKYSLYQTMGKWKIKSNKILGWLRKD
jgi:hypothetical protein